MSIPNAHLNGHAAILDNINDVGLTGLTATLGNNVNIAGVEVNSAVPVTLVVLAKCSAGALTIKVDQFVAGAVHDFTSPAINVTTSSTTEVYKRLNIPAGQSFAVQVTAGASGATITDLLVMTVLELKSGETAVEPSVAQNGAASSVELDVLGSSATGRFDGTGVVDFGPIANHQFLQ